MEVKLLDLTCMQLARLFGLVKLVEPVPLRAGTDWGLLVRGRGFVRLLKREINFTPNLIRPPSAYLPSPMIFSSRAAASNYAQSVGLMTAQSRWEVHGE